MSETSSLLKLGVAFMASGLLMLGASYVVRILVLRHSGLEAAGLYQAAWTIGGLYVGFVVQAMGADFYPRLVTAAGDHDQCNRLVNEQAKVSLLLAAPGVIATLTFAPLVVTLLYSASFAGSVETLRWICLGMALRVITWPIGYIIVAKNRQTLFLITDFAWAAVNVALSWYFVSRFGTVGAGIAFFASYAFHALLVYPIVRRLTGFRWSASNLKYGSLFVLAVGGVFVSSEVLPPIPAAAVGLISSVASALFAARVLMRLATPGALPRPLLRLIQLGGFAR